MQKQISPESRSTTSIIYIEPPGSQQTPHSSHAIPPYHMVHCCVMLYNRTGVSFWMFLSVCDTRCVGNGIVIYQGENLPSWRVFNMSRGLAGSTARRRESCTTTLAVPITLKRADSPNQSHHSRAPCRGCKFRNLVCLSRQPSAQPHSLTHFIHSSKTYS